MSIQYRRVLLKLSGEVLMGKQNENNIDSATIWRVADEIATIHNLGVRLGIVIGGGNFFRGTVGVSCGMDRSTSDYVGMLATVMNGLSLQDILQKKGIQAQVMSTISMDRMCETYTRRQALTYLDENQVVIFVAGMGAPFFTTDTAAALKGLEMNCDVLLKGTKVDGVYSADPKEVKDAVFLPNLSYDQVLSQHLKVMDATAISLARENKMPVIVFSIHEEGGLVRAIKGHPPFTKITETGEE